MVKKIDNVAMEVAQVEFDRFVDCMDLQMGDNGIDVEDKKDRDDHINRIVGAICDGRMTVDDDGQPTYTPKRGKINEPITFYEATGATLQAMDRRKKTEDMGKLFAAMADITKTNASTFSKMKMSDLKVCMSVATLLMV